MSLCMITSIIISYKTCVGQVGHVVKDLTGNEGSEGTQVGQNTSLRRFFFLIQLCYAKKADGVPSKQPFWLPANVCCPPSSFSTILPPFASGPLLCSTRPMMGAAIWH